LPSPRYARAVPPSGNAFAVRRPSGPLQPGLVGARSLAISLFILGFPEMANTFGAYPPSHEEQVPPPNLVGIAMVVLLAIHGRCFAVTAKRFRSHRGCCGYCPVFAVYLPSPRRLPPSRLFSISYSFRAYCYRYPLLVPTPLSFSDLGLKPLLLHTCFSSPLTGGFYSQNKTIVVGILYSNSV
jgi:hypothetical protein